MTKMQEHMTAEECRVSVAKLAATFSGSWSGIYLQRHKEQRENACVSPHFIFNHK